MRFMNTMGRVRQLIDERGITQYKLVQLCGIPYSTLKNTANRQGQLAVDTIQVICRGLGITMSAL